MPEDELTSAEAIELLCNGEIEVQGRMPWSSNATFLVTVRADGVEADAIYKPLRGERPLWDFPPGLHRREVAAYELSEALGFGVVPPTVLRDGPIGEGSVQLFIHADFEQHYFTLHEQRPDLHEQLKAMCVLDLVANNTDRKSGHCLLGPDDRVYGIDHGLCFAAEPKLRTVIWEFGGEAIPPELVEAVGALVACVPTTLADLLHGDEVLAMVRRAQAVVRRPVFPIDTTGRRYPWPLV